LFAGVTQIAIYVTNWLLHNMYLCNVFNSAIVYVPLISALPDLDHCDGYGQLSQLMAISTYDDASKMFHCWKAANQIVSSVRPILHDSLPAQAGIRSKVMISFWHVSCIARRLVTVLLCWSFLCLPIGGGNLAGRDSHVCQGFKLAD